MATLKQLIRRHNITARSEWADSNPHMDDSANMNHFKVTLSRPSPRRRMTLYFSQGYGISGEPTADSVLECLISDASGVEYARGFEEWADDLGFDPDSRKAERTYRATLAQTRKLRAFLGDEYDEFIGAETD